MGMNTDSQTVSDSSVTNKARRLPGRPRGFDPNDALDAAALHFWRDGFDAADVGGIASAIGITKPSLYRLFGDKRSEEHTSELQSLMRISYAVFCLKQKKEKKLIN